MQQAGVRSSRADLKVHLDELHQLYNSTNEEVFSRLGLLSPPSRRPETQHIIYPTSPLVTAAALLEDDSAPRQFTRPRPTGNLFFYRPQSEARTPQEQTQLAAGPLSTPDSPSMVCSGSSEIEDDDNGWSCHKPDDDDDDEKIKSRHHHQIKNKMNEPFSEAFPFPIPPQINNNTVTNNTNINSNRPVVKKDTAALDLILKKAAVFLSPLPQEKENKVVAEEERRIEEERYVSDEIVEVKEQLSPGMLPIVPRVLDFEREEEEDMQQQQRQRPPSATAAAELNNASVVIPAPSTSNNPLNRLKQKTRERQSSHVAAFTKLKQLTVLKQQHRVAAAMTRPSSYSNGSSNSNRQNSEDTYNNSNSTSISIEAKCFQTPILPTAPVAHMTKNLEDSRAVPPPSLPAPVAVSEKGRPSTTIATKTAKPNVCEDAPTTGKKPYLKRRTQAVPMLHQGVPDWSAVKPRTQNKLDSNLILKNNKSTSSSTITNSTSGGGVSVARQGHVTRHIHLPNGNIESMEQYTAQYHHPTHTNTARGGGTSNINTRNGSAMGPLAQGKPLVAATTRPAPAPHQRAIGQQHRHQPQQSRVLKPFDPMTSVTVPPAVNSTSRNRNNAAAFGPLGAAAIAGGGGSTNDYSTQSYSISHEYDPLEDPLRPLVSQVDQLLNSVGRAIRR